LHLLQLGPQFRQLLLLRLLVELPIDATPTTTSAAMPYKLKNNEDT